MIAPLSKWYDSKSTEMNNMRLNKENSIRHVNNNQTEKDKCTNNNDTLVTNMGKKNNNESFGRSFEKSNNQNQMDGDVDNGFYDAKCSLTTAAEEKVHIAIVQWTKNHWMFVCMVLIRLVIVVIVVGIVNRNGDQTATQSTNTS
jgi:hypothetical protein